MSGFRATKAGDAFRLEQKFEERYDAEEKLGTPKSVVDWISATLGNEATACPGTGYQQIHEWLKDGVVLCKFINKISKAAGLPPTTFNAKASSSFVAMSNIENFNNAAKAYGVPQTALFQTPDLFEGRKGPLLNVINCLNQLGFVANSKGFSPRFEGIPTPKLDE
jgi:hypothetical protein